MNKMDRITESLLAGLNEAAEEFRENIEKDRDTNDWGNYIFWDDDVEAAFKAGAEWMAGQGVNFDGIATRRYERMLAGFTSRVVFDQTKAAQLLVEQGEEAEVIVQIRKK